MISRKPISSSQTTRTEEYYSLYHPGKGAENDTVFQDFEYLNLPCKKTIPYKSKLNLN